MKPTTATLPSARGPVMIVERGRMRPLSFASVEAATSYLAQWKDDPSAMAALRESARELPGTGAGNAGSTDQMLRSLARAIVLGDLVVLEPTLRVQPMPVRRPSRAQPASPPPGTARAVLAAQTPPPPPPPPPDLEEVSIQAAEVLPEVLQALDLIDVALGKIDSLTESLAPAPDGIPAIGEEMAEAASDIRERLGEV